MSFDLPLTAFALEMTGVPMGSGAPQTLTLPDAPGEAEVSAAVALAGPAASQGVALRQAPPAPDTTLTF